MIPREPIATKSDEVTVAEFRAYLNGLAATYEDGDSTTPVFTFIDFGRLLRSVAKWRP